MRKFIIKSFIFLIILSIIFFSLSDTYKRKYDIKKVYLAAIIDKHQLLNKNQSKRLILVGGSNLAFGLDGSIISQLLNKNLVNLGLHAGLGIKFMLNEVKPSIKKGDIIVLCFEYPLYLDDYKPDIDLISFAQEIYPPSKNYYHFNLREKFILKFQKFQKRFLPKEFEVNSIFFRDLFDQYGDNIGNLNLTPYKSLIGKEEIGKVNMTISVKMIDEFNTYCQQKGAKLMLSYPSYANSEYLNNKVRIEEINKQLRNDLKNITFINNPADLAFDDRYFFDTIYHLNKIGREKRTEMFIEELKPFMN